ncbi:hypothetical protein K1T71_011905 [Dendrolimus kikuchii]|uniref:Uncharacterized protein n=1 Tax=Dendrolimus kikuchii TaxID=765133 RepID=A0ACC1CML3_9NEOP|nr:hypothetical protein K1T71_011905 [Dendrolimus kikuchii]
MVHKVTGKNVIVTGGASGLGAGFVERLLELGAKNVAVIDIAEQTGKALVERLNQTTAGKAIFVKCDVSKEDEIKAAFDEVLATFKQIDILVNNAGIMDDSPEFWRKSCDLNWQGIVSFTMKAVNHMTKADGGAGGTIINMSSAAALGRGPLVPVYSGSKMAILHFSQNIAMDPFFAQTGIRILIMCCGLTDTAILEGLEKRAYNPELGKLLAKYLPAAPSGYQKISSAVDAFIQMYETGSPGSIWYSSKNQPGRDITKIVNTAFDEFDRSILKA